MRYIGLGLFLLGVVSGGHYATAAGPAGGVEWGGSLVVPAAAAVAVAIGVVLVVLGSGRPSTRAESAPRPAGSSAVTWRG